MSSLIYFASGGYVKDEYLDLPKTHVLLIDKLGQGINEKINKTRKALIKGLFHFELFYGIRSLLKATQKIL